MTLLPAKLFQPRRYSPGGLGNWSGHLPFAHDLIAALRPNLLVELGTHYGESYFGWCQAVAENGIPCKCFAVDTWQGDPHAGYYDETVFQEVHEYNALHYASFSTLLRATFDQASDQFSNETIDLLHIDGLHTYDAVAHDFHTWFPKVRPGGLVLLHDTGARHADFQVWRLWEELNEQYSCFEFRHSWGLGVLRKPGRESEDSGFVRTLFLGSAEERAFLQHYYSQAANALAWEQQKAFKSPSKSAARLQVFPYLQEGYQEATSVVVAVERDRWEVRSIGLPQGSGCGPIRIDPVDAPSSVEIRTIIVRRAADKAVLASWTQAAEILSFQCESDLTPVPGSDPALFIGTGPDPKLVLPELDKASQDQPLVIEITLRVTSRIASAIQTLVSSEMQSLQEKTREAETARHRAELARDEASTVVCSLQREFQILQTEHETLKTEHDTLKAEHQTLKTEHLSAIAAYECEVNAVRNMVVQLEEFRRAIAQEQDIRIELEQDLTAFRTRFDQETKLLSSVVESERRRRVEILNSYSWKITAPLRKVFHLILNLRPTEVKAQGRRGPSASTREAPHDK